MNHFQALKSAHEKGKLAHAYLFSGNDEEKKEQVIEEFAQFLLGPGWKEDHANVSIISPEKSEITIKQIRDLKEKMSRSAWNAAFKVGIIRNAERMNQEAQSAFLKLLEEPSPSTLFFVHTAHSFLLLDTIRSRMQELTFYSFAKRPVAHKGVLVKLQQASLAERFEFAQKVAEDPLSLREALVDLQQEAREQFLADLKEKKHDLVLFLRMLQEVMRLLGSTNINPRLAAERALLLL